MGNMYDNNDDMPAPQKAYAPEKWEQILMTIGAVFCILGSFTGGVLFSLIGIVIVFPMFFRILIKKQKAKKSGK